MCIAIVRLKQRRDSVAVGVLLSYLFWGNLLMRCRDVESNSGPSLPQSKGQHTVRQTRRTSRASSSWGSMGRPDNPSGTASSKAGKEHALSDVVKTTMETCLVEVKDEFRDVRAEYGAMQDELRALRREVTGLRQQNEDLQRRKEDLSRKVEELVRKTDDLEEQSKHNELVFYRNKNETPADCKGIVKDFITDKLQLPQDVKFDRVCCVCSKSDSPVIASCVFYKQKIAVLKTKGKLRGTNIIVGEDFSTQVRDIRRRLTPYLKKG